MKPASGPSCKLSAAIGADIFWRRAFARLFAMHSSWSRFLARFPERARGVAWSIKENSMTDEIAYLTAGELVARYRAGTLSPVDSVAAALKRIDRLEPHLNAFQR